jgi:hypothetical protein
VVEAVDVDAGKWRLTDEGVCVGTATKSVAEGDAADSEFESVQSALQLVAVSVAEEEEEEGDVNSVIVT